MNYGVVHNYLLFHEHTKGMLGEGVKRSVCFYYMYTGIRLRTNVETSRMLTVLYVHVLVVTAEKNKASYLHKTLSRKSKVVHRTPTKHYQKFVNVFVFVSSGKRGQMMQCLMHSECGRATQKQN